MMGVLNGLRALELAGAGPTQRTNLLDGVVRVERSGDRGRITPGEKDAVLGSRVLSRIGPHALDDRERVFGRQRLAATAQVHESKQARVRSRLGSCVRVLED